MYNGPAASYLAVTKSDTVDVSTTFFRGLYIGGTGDVAVVPPNGTAAVVFTGALAGTILPVIGRRVNSTGTSATNIVALF